MFSKLTAQVQTAGSWITGQGEPQQHAEQQHHSGQQSQSHHSTQHTHAAGNEEKEQSLTTVLTSREDRENLLLLIAGCTSAMRTTLGGTFDPRQPSSSSSSQPDSSKQKADHSEDLIQLESSSDAVAQTTTSSDTSHDAKTGLQGLAEQEGHENELTPDQLEKEHQRRAAELAAPEMQALKKAALNHFDEWRDRVIGRVGEALNEKSAVSNTSAPVTAGAEDAKIITEQPPTKVLDNTASAEYTSATDALAQLYPPQPSGLTALPQAKRLLILHSLLLLLLSLERYTSESRVLLLSVTASIHLPASALAEDEAKVALGLLEAAKRQMSADEETKKKAAEGSASRAWKVGLGTVAGAALIGVTGGLAAPLLAAGVGSVMGGLGLGTTVAATYLGAMAGSAPLVGVLFGAYGGRMTGQAIDRYAADVSDFAFVPLHKDGNSNSDSKASQHHHSRSQHDHKSSSEAEPEADTPRRLRVAIGISGYLTTPSDITTPWLILSPSTTEPFALRFELDAMLSLGNALTAYVKSYAWGWAKNEIIKRTLFAAVTAGLWPLGLLKFSKVVDNPFSIAKARADKAGQVLADALCHRVQGERPVTLIGYSLGARVISETLTTLADRKAFGLIENVVLLGAPAPSDSVHWRKMRSVVAGRVINAYAANDYLLAFLYRTATLQLGCAGLQAVRDVPGVENVDVSKYLAGVAGGHTQYRFLTGAVLRDIGFEDLALEEVEKQEEGRKRVEKKAAEEKERAENDEHGEVTDEHVESVRTAAEKGKQEGMMGWVSGAVGSLGFGGGKAQKEEHLSEEEKLKQAGA